MIEQEIEKVAKEYVDLQDGLDTWGPYELATMHFKAGVKWALKQMGWEEYDPEHPPEPGEYVVWCKLDEHPQMISGGISKWEFYGVTHYLKLPTIPAFMTEPKKEENGWEQLYHRACTEIRDAESELTALRERVKELNGYMEQLKNSYAVHNNILAQRIALTKAQAIHIAGLSADIEQRARLYDAWMNGRSAGLMMWRGITGNLWLSSFKDSLVERKFPDLPSLIDKLEQLIQEGK